jgi:hypothetical protein
LHGQKRIHEDGIAFAMNECYRIGHPPDLPCPVEGLGSSYRVSWSEASNLAWAYILHSQ